MADDRLLSIGDVANIAGVPITTLRYYEHIGLLLPPPRRSGQRRYDKSVFARLMVIRFAKIAGLSVHDIAIVLADTSPERERTSSVVRAKLVEIELQLRQLGMAQRMMTAVLSCRCTDFSECDCGALGPIIEEIRAAAHPFEAPHSGRRS